MADFEKLGVFYLGKKYDIKSRKTSDNLVLYDSSDLCTHAVCIGMTGSGKTGLCLGLLEEAAIDGIPVIAIDPKGDIGNLLLTFPNLAPSDFEPWMDSAEARRRNLSVTELATAEAQKWQAGLGQWGQDGERIKRLRAAADISIYTPGANSGLAVSILHSLACPGPAVLDDSDLLRERIASAAACVLALLGISFDPLKSREYILLSSIIGDAWKKSQDIALSDLVALIQKPPLTRMGAIDLETFYPAKERLDLSLAINNLLAAPGFESWLEGEALDVDKFLYCQEGKPRISIFSISHLADQERMFFVTLLLNQIISWMRTQSGTSSLRAIVYMDEIYGFFPPVANPPAKQPLLTLLKQARAFGIGMVLASQNPVDIDYKGLANTGTWFIGRLQTERDKQRVLDGLESATMESGGSNFDRQNISEILSSLSSRVFLLHNVHEDSPLIFESRWTMSYLRGPLSRLEIKRLMEPSKSNKASKIKVDESASNTARAGLSNAGAAATKTISPVIDSAISQVFIPVKVAAFSGNIENILEATLLASATVHFSDSKLGIEFDQEKNYLVPVASSGPVAIDFHNAKSIKVNLADLGSAAAANIVSPSFREPHAALVNSNLYKDYKRDFTAFLSTNCKLTLWKSPSTGLTSKPGEAERDFRIRLVQATSESRDSMVARLREKYQPKMAAIQEKIRLADLRINQEEAQAKQAQLDSAIAIGATVFGAMMGRKKFGAATVGRATTAAHGVNRAAKQMQDVDLAKCNRDELSQKLVELDNQFKSESAALATRFDSQSEKLDEIVLLPKKTAIKVNLIGLAWVKG